MQNNWEENQDDQEVLKGIIISLAEISMPVIPDYFMLMTEKLIEYVKKGKLFAYLKVMDEIAPKNTFGPSKWVIDISGKSFEENWANMYKLYEEQKELGDQGIASDFWDYCMSSLANSQAEWKRMQFDLLPEGYGKDFDSVHNKYLEKFLANKPTSVH